MACKKEYRISYSIFDGEDELQDFMVCLPSWWKVVWWFIRRGRKACQIYIWTSARIK